MSKNRCIICNAKGYGIIIKDNLICAHCEKKVVECDVNSEFYQLYKDKFKKEIYKKKLG